jgi:hypothetical protein
MGYSPFLRAVGFWGSFYVFYHYARKDAETKQYVYPSYLIFKEKIVKDIWKNGFNGERLETAASQYSGELWKEVKSIYQ